MLAKPRVRLSVLQTWGYKAAKVLYPYQQIQFKRSFGFDPTVRCTSDGLHFPGGFLVFGTDHHTAGGVEELWCRASYNDLKQNPVALVQK